MRKTNLFIFGSLLVLLAWRVPGLVESMAQNRTAVYAVAGCSDGETTNSQAWPKTASGGSVGEDAWLVVIRARCTGDDAAVLAAIHGAIAASDERLDAAHAMAEYNVDLARFASDKYTYNAEAHYWLGQALTKAGDKAGAIQAYEQGLALQPDAEVWLELGRLYQSKDDYEKAAEAYDQACVLKDIQANGCSGAGDLYLKMGKYEQAAKSYQDSINEISHTWIPSEEGLVTALMALDRTQEAIPHLRILADNGSTEAQQMLQKLGQAGK